MQTLYQILLNTPWWVYVLLVYLLCVGYKASKPGTVSIKKLLILPVLFSVMSIHSLVTVIGVNGFSVSVYGVALLVGIGLGWWQITNRGIIVDKTHLLVKSSGTWSTLIIIFIIFFTKYYFGYELALDPAKAHQSGFEFSLLAVSGVCTGLFVGRVLCVFSRMFTQDSVDLT